VRTTRQPCHTGLAGLNYQPRLDGLVARLVADTDGGEALPLLACTLAQVADGVELPEPVRAALEPFVTRRLLTTDDDGDALEVAHEAFLSAWPPLAMAIEADSAACERAAASSRPRRRGSTPAVRPLGFGSAGSSPPPWPTRVRGCGNPPGPVSAGTADPADRGGGRGGGSSSRSGSS
jgi:conflict system STAND superfamily ATPase